MGALGDRVFACDVTRDCAEEDSGVVAQRERDSERESLCVCVCVCVCDRAYARVSECMSVRVSILTEG